MAVMVAPSGWSNGVITPLDTDTARICSRSVALVRRARRRAPSEAVEADRAEVGLARRIWRCLEAEDEAVVGNLPQAQRRQREAPVGPDPGAERLLRPELSRPGVTNGSSRAQS